MSRILQLCRTTTPTSECEESQRRGQLLRAPRRPGPRRGHLRRQFPRSSDHHRDDARDARRAPPHYLRHLGLDPQRRQTSHRQPCSGAEVDGHAAAACGSVAVTRWPFYRSRGGRALTWPLATRRPVPLPRCGSGAGSSTQLAAVACSTSAAWL